jgi:hypothetical protein
MSTDIFVLVKHHAGTVTDATHELLGKAGELGGPTVACLFGHGARDLGEGLAADTVLAVEDPMLEHFIPEAYVATLATLISEREPRLVLIANTTVGAQWPAARRLLQPARVRGCGHRGNEPGLRRQAERRGRDRRPGDRIGRRRFVHGRDRRFARD